MTSLNFVMWLQIDTDETAKCETTFLAYDRNMIKRPNQNKIGVLRADMK